MNDLYQNVGYVFVMNNYMEINSFIKNYDYLIGIYLICYVVVSVMISNKLLKSSSDHYFYEYYTDLIRRNGRKFLVYFPNFVNKTPVMDPQLLYWILSFFSKKKMKYVALLLNPVVMFILLLSIYLVLKFDHREAVGFYTCILVGFVPQYYYLNNSRLSGLSGRGVGMLLIFIICLVLVYFETSKDGALLWILYGVILSILIVLTNIFALQTLILFGVSMLVLFGNYYLLVMLLIGVSLMLLVDYKYTNRYLHGLVDYWILYKDLMAEKFILSHRPSIYRDFIKDFFVVFKRNKVEFLYYAYSNSLVILFSLSSFGITFVLWLLYGKNVDLSNIKDAVALKICISALFAFFIISLRGFRYWGEPERYVEMANPLIVYLVVSLSISHKNMMPILIMFMYFSIVNVFQYLFYVIPYLLLTKRLRKSNNLLRSQVDVANSIKFVLGNTKQKNIIFFSNNQNLEKIMLCSSWKFLYYWPSIDNFDGYKFDECFIRYPYVSSAVIDGLINRNTPTHILFDSSHGDIESNEIKTKYTEIYSENNYRLWAKV